MPQQPLTHFDIRPYTGALPIAFGMRREEVHRLLGPPETSFPIWNKSGFSESYLRGVYNVGYDNAWIVNHVGFAPGPLDLSINGQPIWSIASQPDPNPALLGLDPEPVAYVGAWAFLRIGVKTTGYHDDDSSQRAVTVFPRDRIAFWTAKGTPADTGRYAAA